MQAPSRKKAPPKYDFSQQVGHLLRRAYQRHVAIFQKIIPDERLTGAQFCLLCALRDNGASSMSELCKATAIDQATVRGIIERLKARKLITTSADDADRRKVIVALAPAGDALLDEVMPVGLQISELTVANLNPAEQVALLYLLRKLGADADSEAAVEHSVEASSDFVDEPPAIRRASVPARRARARE